MSLILISSWYQIANDIDVFKYKEFCGIHPLSNVPIHHNSWDKFQVVGEFLIMSSTEQQNVNAGDVFIISYFGLIILSREERSKLFLREFWGSTSNRKNVQERHFYSRLQFN